MPFENPKTGVAAGLPPIRACLFDMDGLLIDSEDLYTICTNEVLREYGKPDIPWNIKAQLQGRPGPEAGKIFASWAQLPITRDEFLAKQSILQRKYFPSTKPLAGVPSLLQTLKHSTSPPVHVALATSSHRGNFALKTDHLSDLFGVFEAENRILGDDERIPKGRGKPCPDIYLLALETVNVVIRRRNEERRRAVRSKDSGGSLSSGEERTAKDGGLGGGEQDEKEVAPEECLVFEDSVPGVEAGRRAGMQVVWCPHPGLLKEYEGREEEVLAGLSGMGTQPDGESGQGAEKADSQIEEAKVGRRGDGWARLFADLDGFPHREYGIEVKS